MKLASSILLLALVAVPVLAQPTLSGATDGANVFAERGDHATIKLSPETRKSVRLSGTLLDNADRPIADAEIRIVRFEVTGADRGPSKVVPLSELNAQVEPYVIKQTIPLVTAKDGSFSFDQSLPPGRYSLQVDWNDLPETTSFVQWDLHWVNEGHHRASMR